MKNKLILTLFITLIFLSGCSVKKIDDLSQAEKFSKEYSVSKDNPFKYIGIDEVLEMFKTGTGIVFFGNSDSELSMEAVKLFTEAFNSSNIKDIDIYYYNPVVIRDNLTQEYKELLNLLDGYLEEDSVGEEYLYLPDVYFIRNGKILDHNNDVAFIDMNDDEYLLEDIKKNVIDKYVKLLEIYYEEDTNE